MHLETGVDIIEIDRIEQALARFGDRFRQRVYLASEVSDCDGRPGSLAARFAAKEAVIKALGTGRVSLRDVEVVRRPGERPVVRLHGRALARSRELGVQQVSISLSHCRKYAVAVAVLVRSADEVKPN